MTRSLTLRMPERSLRSDVSFHLLRIRVCDARRPPSRSKKQGFPAGIRRQPKQCPRASGGNFGKTVPTMGSTLEGESRAGSSFSEKSFYLAEFRGRTLAIAVPAADLGAPAPLAAVLKELEAN